MREAEEEARLEAERAEEQRQASERAAAATAEKERKKKAEEERRARAVAAAEKERKRMEQEAAQAAQEAERERKRNEERQRKKREEDKREAERYVVIVDIPQTPLTLLRSQTRSESPRKSESSRRSNGSSRPSQDRPRKCNFAHERLYLNTFRSQFLLRSVYDYGTTRLASFKSMPNFSEQLTEKFGFTKPMALSLKFRWKKCPPMT